MYVSERPMLEKWIDRYNDACRVLALHAMDYQNHIGTDQEVLMHTLLLSAVDEVRALNIYKAEVFGNAPSIFAVPNQG